MKKLLLLLFPAILGAQQARNMTRSGTGLGDSSLVVMSDTNTSKTTFLTRAASLAQIRKGLSKFAFDSLKVSGDLFIHQGTGNGIFTIGNASSASASEIVMQSSSTQKSWLIATNYNASGQIEFTPSTAAGGSTFSTSALTLTPTAAVFGSLAVSGVTSLSIGGAFSGATTGAFSGAITSTLVTGTVLKNISGTTGELYNWEQNTTGNLLWGIESSAGGAVFPGSSAYASFFGSNGATAVELYTNNARRVKIASGGGIFAYNLTAEGSTKSALCIDPVTFEIETNAAATCTVSSRRFKHNIRLISFTSSNRIVSQLKPVAYIENESNRKAIGIVAEDAYVVDPRLASKDSKGVITSTNYEEITSLLVKVVQEQQKKIDSLSIRLTKLEKKH